MSWPQVTIEKSCNLITDGTHYTPPDVDVGVPFLTVKDFTHDGQADLVGCSHITNDEFDKADKGNSAPKIGDVLFSKDGTVGKVYVVQNQERFAVLSSMAILRPDPKILEAPYFGWVLKTESCLDQASRSKTGSAIRRIILKDLKRVKFPLPPLEEQKRIAGILDAADALRAKRRESLARLDDLLQSTFLDMFGDPVTNPKGWEVPTLGDICTKITDGTHHSPPVTEDGIPYITAKHLKIDGLKFFENPWFVSKEDHEQIYSRCDPKPGDVLYIKDGATTGIAAINRYDFPFSMLSSLALIRPDTEVFLAEFLCAFLNNERNKMHLLENMGGAAIKRLTLTKIKKFKVPLPPLDLQRRFAEIVSSVEEQKAKMRKHPEQLDDLFASLQQRAFRGDL